MEEAVDGEYQKFKSRDGAYVREHFFGKYPQLKAMVASMSDEDIWRLNRGGHDPHKIYAAYHAAVNHPGQPTVVLAKTVKGYGMGAVGEGKNVAHQAKKMPIEVLRQFRDRFAIPIGDDRLGELPYFKPADNSPEMAYMRERRAKLGGSIPQRRRRTMGLDAPKLENFKTLLEATAEGRENSTTMAFVRMLTALVRDKNLGRNIVPIVPDESRTFGMEGLFRQLGIYSSVGQLYEPEDSDQLMFYKEDKNGQILQEGIN
jgi:pyruvate dehydrogenase E1 component